MMDKKRVFVLMPFGAGGEYQGGVDEANFVYDHIIRPGIEKQLGKGTQIHREVDENKPGLITNSIVTSIAEADIVIADLTGHNPNVFLELGMRYTLRSKITIVLAQEGTVIPFDIKGYRLIFYHRFKVREAQDQIAKFIGSSLERPDDSDSIVFDTLKKLSVDLPGVTSSRGIDLRGRSVMTWNEYTSKLDAAIEWLRAPVLSAKYVPNAILGISNGGMIVADLLGKALFRGTPVLSLWASRFANRPYFDNPFNAAICRALRGRPNKETKKLRLLLVDDHVSSGNTAGQAIEYLRAKLGAGTRILFVPLVSRRREHLKPLEEHLPYRYRERTSRTFQVSERDFYAALDTQAKYFPYLSKEVSEGLDQIDAPDVGTPTTATD